MGNSGLARLAVEDERHAHLRKLHHGVHPSPLVPDGNQNRLAGIVIVPDVVMGGLEMPDALAGGGLERQRAVAEEILTDAVASVEIESQRAGGYEDDPPLDVHRHPAPAVGSS